MRRCPPARRDARRPAAAIEPRKGDLKIARHRYSRDTSAPKRTRVNHLIRISPVRVIGADNEPLGILETSEAMRLADEAGLDLVEISPDARPPVCKIMDYGKYKYEQSKKDQKGKAASKASELKEIRLGRSVKIDEHDVQIRVEQARKFLMAGHKVLVTQRFRGREIAHKELGVDRLARVADSLSDISKVEMAPRWSGRQASITLAPDKVKIEAVKRRLAKEQGEQQKQAAAPEPKPQPQSEPDREEERTPAERSASNSG